MHDHGVSFLERIAASLGSGLPAEWQWLVLPFAMFLAGLAGSATHCAGMCGPFVLAQTQARLSRLPLESYDGMMRLRGALALPYHLGRTVTYSGLGVLAGGVAGGLASMPLWPHLMALMLGLAALLFLVQAAGQLGALLPSFKVRLGLFDGLTAGLARFTEPLLADPTGLRGLLLGLVLGFLPCGLLYAALSAAAGSGSAWQGGVAMLAFVTGTMPGLMLVGFGGTTLMARAPVAAKWIAALLYAFNGGLLALLALRALV